MKNIEMKIWNHTQTAPMKDNKAEIFLAYFAKVVSFSQQ